MRPIHVASTLLVLTMAAAALLGQNSGPPIMPSGIDISGSWYDVIFQEVARTANGRVPCPGTHGHVPDYRIDETVLFQVMRAADRHAHEYMGMARNSPTNMPPALL